MEPPRGTVTALFADIEGSTRLLRELGTDRVENAARLVILAIDQGTTGTTCLVVDEELRVRGRGYRELRQYFPQPGWVEHDPEEIWATVVEAADAAVHDAGVRAADLRAIGITNQRETTLLWERATGRPVNRAIVWQDRRTAARCRELPADLIRARTGLVPDPYFSATKLEWLLARTEARPDELAFGTVDSWLVWKLTDGARPRHRPDERVTDDVARSRVARLGRRAARALRRRPCAAASPRPLVRGGRRGEATRRDAADRGHRRRPAGGAVRARLPRARRGEGDLRDRELRPRQRGSRARAAAPGLLETAEASGGYALEGAILSSGAAIQWLRDGLGILNDPAESEALARQVESTGGVYFVPALTGLGSPHWNADARGLVTGITRGTSAAHLVRAALEGIAFQVADVLDAFPASVGVLRADGGASANGFLMQFQADLLGCPVEVAAERETTALGAAALAGLATGIWPNLEDIRSSIRRGATYEPSLDRAWVAGRRAEWQVAVRRAVLK